MNKKIIRLLIGAIVIATALFFIGMPYLNNYFFDKKLDLFLENKSEPKLNSFSSTEFSKLPDIVKKHLKYSINNISTPPQFCQYIVVGKGKNDINSDWREITSQNYYSATSPDFIKKIETKSSFPFWSIKIKKYVDRKASINSKFISSIPTYSFEGNKLNRSYLVLYLLESVFCPTVLLPDANVKWKGIDDRTALATIWDGDIKGTALFHFNKNGEVIKIETDNRYKRNKIDYKNEKFTLHLANYKNVGDFKIPTYFEYQWNLPANDFTFGRFHISEINYKNLTEK